jgi:hypothetical protein
MSLAMACPQAASMHQQPISSRGTSLRPQRAQGLVESPGLFVRFALVMWSSWAVPCALVYSDFTAVHCMRERLPGC